MRIVWSPQADEDLLQIWIYISGKATDTVADAQTAKIETACRKLSDWPLSGRARETVLPGMRSVTVAPYVVFYYPMRDHVRIVRVLHGHRDIEAVFGEDDP